MPASYGKMLLMAQMCKNNVEKQCNMQMKS